MYCFYRRDSLHTYIESVTPLSDLLLFHSIHISLLQNPRNSTVSNDEPYSNALLNSSDGATNFVDYPPTAPVDSSVLEYGQCALRGYLYKKERFMTWGKLFCIIRNNFLECHKSHGDSCNPSLKLFLPGSEVKEGGGDAKKKWAFQVSFCLWLEC